MMKACYKQIYCLLMCSAVICLYTMYRDNSLHTISGRKDAATIPKIIHQHWENCNIPAGIDREWISSWSTKHPDWQYWFWSEDDVRCFLKREYPDFLNYYNSYSIGVSKGGIFRADAMRYFVLSHFGGVYADLDAECLKPLDAWIGGENSCVVSEETPEHPYLVFEKEEGNLINAVMMCAPGHPFMINIREELPRRVTEPDILKATGPLLVTDMWKSYTNSTKKHPNVTIANYKYFMPRFDPTIGDQLRETCVGSKYPSLNLRAKTLCDALLKRKFSNEPLNVSYVDHHWIHMSLSSEWRQMDTVSITDIVPNVVTYQSIYGHCYDEQIQ